MILNRQLNTISKLKSFEALFRQGRGYFRAQIILINRDFLGVSGGRYGNNSDLFGWRYAKNRCDLA